MKFNHWRNTAEGNYFRFLIKKKPQDYFIRIFSSIFSFHIPSFILSNWVSFHTFNFRVSNDDKILQWGKEKEWDEKFHAMMLMK